MNKIKLPSMVEFVSILGESSTFDKDITDWINEELGKLEKIRSFTKRISQQPNIGMFVPSVFEDGEWRILEAPNRSTHTNEECDQYQTALDNVIFEGCEYSDKELFLDGNLFWVFLNKLNFEKGLTIEQLTPHNLTLTPKFAKELGLI
jgi:hypothetical protein